MATTLTSREFNSGRQRREKGRAAWPCLHYGSRQAAHVLLTIEDYRRLAGGALSLVDALAQPDGAHFDFKPPRIGGFAKAADLA